MCGHTFAELADQVVRTTDFAKLAIANICASFDRDSLTASWQPIGRSLNGAATAMTKPSQQNFSFDGPIAKEKPSVLTRAIDFVMPVVLGVLGITVGYCLL